MGLQVAETVRLIGGRDIFATCDIAGTHDIDLLMDLLRWCLSHLLQAVLATYGVRRARFRLHNGIINAFVFLAQRWDVSALQNTFNRYLATGLRVNVDDLDDGEVLAGICMLTDTMEDFLLHYGANLFAIADRRRHDLHR